MKRSKTTRPDQVAVPRTRTATRGKRKRLLKTYDNLNSKTK